MTIRALYTTGRLEHGGSVWRTPPSQPPTCLEVGLVVMMTPALWGCKAAKSFVSELMWDRFLPKSKTTCYFIHIFRIQRPDSDPQTGKNVPDI